MDYMERIAKEIETEALVPTRTYSLRGTSCIELYSHPIRGPVEQGPLPPLGSAPLLPPLSSAPIQPLLGSAPVQPILENVPAFKPVHETPKEYADMTLRIDERTGEGRIIITDDLEHQIRAGEHEKLGLDHINFEDIIPTSGTTKGKDGKALGVIHNKKHLDPGTGGY